VPEVGEAEGHLASWRYSEQGSTHNCTGQLYMFISGPPESQTPEDSLSKQEVDLLLTVMLSSELIPWSAPVHPSNHQRCRVKSCTLC
jgi:hypothetical protein